LLGSRATVSPGYAIVAAIVPVFMRSRSHAERQIQRTATAAVTSFNLPDFTS
jgi:hypothetical protein